MAQITTGIRSVLAHPAVYNLLQTVMGSHRTNRLIAERHIRALPGQRILDIGCGTANILPFLPESIDYQGYDVSEAYIAAARRRFPNRGQFHCRPVDALASETLGQFDLVLAIGVLHHLDDEAARGLMTTARSALKEGGRLITADAVLVDGQNPIARLIVKNDRGRNVRDPEGYAALARTAFGLIETSTHHQAWIPFSFFAMECSNP